MKKYLLGVLAIVLAVGFTAFTQPNLKVGNITVKYIGTDPTDDNSVSDPQNWQKETGSLSCGGSEKPCSIVIDESYLDGNNKLRSTLVITVAPTLQHYVPTAVIDEEEDPVTTTISDKD